MYDILYEGFNYRSVYLLKCKSIVKLMRPRPEQGIRMALVPRAKNLSR